MGQQSICGHGSGMGTYTGSGGALLVQRSGTLNQDDRVAYDAAPARNDAVRPGGYTREPWQTR